MPQNWKTYKFIDFADINPPIRLNRGNDYPYIEMKDLDSNSKYADSKRERSLQGGSRFQNGDTLCARISPCLENGKICQARLAEGEFGFGSTEFLVFRGKENISSSEYIYYVSRSPQFRGFSENRMIGTSGRQRIGKESYEDFVFEAPPLQEQKSIASILSALDDKIENNLAMNKTLEEMAMALYKHWFVDFGPFQEDEFVPSELGDIPKGWEVKRLDSLIKFSNGYAFKSKQLLKQEEPDSYHIFKMGHIQKGGGLKANGTKSWVKRSECSGLNKYVLKTGDILMSMTDMKDNMTILGHTALMNENDKFIVNQRVGLLRIDNQINVGYPFVFMLTNSYDYIDRLRSQANSGVQVNLSTDAIKSSKVITPSADVNLKFHNHCLPLFEQINENSIENQTLTTLRDTLLPKLISGEVRVKDAEQTVASAL
jgi:type I restriction enzyme S subunit